MIRAIFAVAIIFFATFFLPFWIQIGLYIIAILLINYRTFLLVPALFADAWYAPVRSLSPMNNKTVLVVLGLILVHQIIIRTTRITAHYGLPKK